ncbi:zinc ribbon domain-containing protein [Methylotuvimicrobium buryatense]|uniref:Zinc ribbon domain-containing protein n=1 Tax=Methylotuvimicrobium buryatense TaxID=95641 RepID=A0A4P9USA8_METBY|nr:zinc ribbon domain-containing protein [Methylotuvimicrobium buryatense]QCW84404.1 zinc ribbon domain-containing protein [Methylotuvimicrobium buryatense]
MSSFKSSGGYRAAQYLITILIVLLVGYLISLLPVMSRLVIADRLVAADLVLFVTQITALILFYLFAVNAIAALPKTGGALFFVKAISVPAALLVIVIIGQAVIWQVLGLFVGASGRSFYFGIAILLIVLIGIWLVWVAFQNSPYLIDSIEEVRETLPALPSLRTSVCPECGQLSSRSAKFCCHCGHPKHKEFKCSACGEALQEDQKFCHSCGHEVEAYLEKESES